MADYFNPYSTTVKVSATTTASSGVLSKGGEVRVYNDSGSTVFVKFSSSDGNTADLSCMPIPPFVPQYLNIRDRVYVSAIYRDGAGNVYFTSTAN